MTRPILYVVQYMNPMGDGVVHTQQCKIKHKPDKKNDLQTAVLPSQNVQNHNGRTNDNPLPFGNKAPGVTETAGLPSPSRISAACVSFAYHLSVKVKTNLVLKFTQTS